MMPDSLLYFVVLPSRRKWRTGETAPRSGEPLVLLETLPGRLTAWGSSHEEAGERLEMLLDSLSTKLEDSPEARTDWFDRAFDEMSEQEKALWRGALSALPPPVLRTARHFAYFESEDCPKAV
jgi:hypothetical protein